MQSGQTNLLNLLGQNAAGSTNNLPSASGKTSKNNAIAGTSSTKEFAELLQRKNINSVNLSAEKLVKTSESGKIMSQDLPNDISQSGKQMPLFSMFETAGIDSDNDENDNNAESDADILREPALFLANSMNVDAVHGSTPELTEGDDPLDSIELDGDGLSDSILSAVSPEKLIENRDSLTFDETTQLNAEVKISEGNIGFLPGEIKTNINFNQSQLANGENKSFASLIDDPTGKALPIFYRDVLPRFGATSSVDPSAENVDKKIDSTETKLNLLKTADLSQEFNWLKDARGMNLADRKEAMNQSVKGELTATLVNSNGIDIKKDFGAIFQNEIHSSGGALQFEPTISLSNLHMSGDGKDLAVQRNQQLLSSNAPFSRGLNLKQDFTPNLALRVQWMFNQALSSAEILMDPPEMGPLSIKVQHHHGETSILFQVSNATTKDALDDSMPKLRDMLSQQGILLGDAQVKQQDHNSSSDRSAQQQQNESGELLADEELPVKTTQVISGLVDVYS